MFGLSLISSVYFLIGGARYLVQKEKVLVNEKKRRWWNGEIWTCVFPCRILYGLKPSVFIIDWHGDSNKKIFYPLPENVVGGSKGL